MINQDFYIARLIAGYLSGEITPEEEQALSNWRKESPEHEALFHRICDENQLKQRAMQQALFHPEDAWGKVNRRIQRDSRRRIYIKMMRYAAMFLLPILLVGLSLRYITPPSPSQAPAREVQAILPGESKAILTLDDGQIVQLNKQETQTLKATDGTHIQIDSTLLNYQLAEQNQPVKAPIYNKVETPQGGEYTLCLSDGTKVHLNAMSSLRFPVSFGEGRRCVELQGEAFFEVSKNGYPFIVEVNGMQVEVLGTSFNISAYPDETYQTTLLDGSVKVATATGESCILTPHQQASVTPGNSSIEVCMVDADMYTSWTRGKIQFKDRRLEDIMKSLARWYDVKVIYADEKIKDIRFGAHVDRYAEIAPFVRLLEQTQKVRAKVDNKTITFYN